MCSLHTARVSRRSSVNDVSTGTRGLRFDAVAISGGTLRMYGFVVGRIADFTGHFFGL